MKLVSYLKDEHDQLAMLENDLLYDADLLHMELPSSMSMFLNFWEDNYVLGLKIQQAIKDKRIGKEKGFPVEDAHLLAPIPFPASCRRNYIFKNNTEQYPRFYFSNHHSIQGAGSVMCMPDHFHQLDFVPSIAIIISKLGRNIPAEEADEYIGGFMIMNVFTAHNFNSDAIQPNDAGKNDFSITTGPYFVTPDELVEFEAPAKEGHVGKTWNLNMKCSINDKQISELNLSDMNCTFAELVEQASYGATLFPGDIISNGVIHSGCLYELNSAEKSGDENPPTEWLQEGDVVEIEVNALGILINTIEKEESDFSLIKKENRIDKSF